MFNLFRHPKPVGDGKAIATQVVNQAGTPVLDVTTFVVTDRHSAAQPLGKAQPPKSPIDDDADKQQLDRGRDA